MVPIVVIVVNHNTWQPCICAVYLPKTVKQPLLNLWVCEFSVYAKLLALTVPFIFIKKCINETNGTLIKLGLGSMLTTTESC